MTILLSAESQKLESHLIVTLHGADRDDLFRQVMEATRFDDLVGAWMVGLLDRSFHLDATSDQVSAVIGQVCRLVLPGRVSREADDLPVVARVMEAVAALRDKLSTADLTLILGTYIGEALKVRAAASRPEYAGEQLYGPIWQAVSTLMGATNMTVPLLGTGYRFAVWVVGVFQGPNIADKAVSDCRNLPAEAAVRMRVLDEELIRDLCRTQYPDLTGLPFQMLLDSVLPFPIPKEWFTDMFPLPPSDEIVHLAPSHDIWDQF